MLKKLQALMPILTLLLVTFGVYYPVIGFDFVWDDAIYFRDLASYRATNNIIAKALEPFAIGSNYFRPLALITLIIEAKVWGTNPAPFHIFNLLIHLANTTLVFALAGIISKKYELNKYCAILSSTLYALHPALIEPVSFISCRFDLLVTFFMLSGLLAERVTTKVSLRIPLVCLFFLLAALSKEMAVIFLPVLMVIQRGNHPNFKRQLAAENKLYISLLVTGIFYIALRYFSFGYIISKADSSFIPVGNLTQHITLIGQSLFEYSKLILWPYNYLSPIHYSDLPMLVTPLATALAVVMILACSTWIFISILKPGSSRLLMSAGLIALLPVINITPLELGGGAFVAERFLTFPLVLFALSTVTAIHKMLSVKKEFRRLSTFPLIGLILASFLTIVLTLPHWRNDMMLWDWALDKAPRSDLPQANLIRQLAEAGEYDRAIKFADIFLKDRPNDSETWNNRGLALARTGQYKEAEDSFKKACELSPKSATNWTNLANTLRELGRLDEAEALFKDKALKLDSLHPYAHFGLGLVYQKKGVIDKARSELNRAEELAADQDKEIIRKVIQSL